MTSWDRLRLLRTFILVCTLIGTATALRFERAAELIHGRLYSQLDPVDSWRQTNPMDKRHIFYTGGWGAGGGALSTSKSELKPMNPARKSMPDSSFGLADGALGRSVSTAGLMALGSSNSGMTGRLSQLFVSRGWGNYPFS